MFWEDVPLREEDPYRRAFENARSKFDRSWHLTREGDAEADLLLDHLLAEDPARRASVVEREERFRSFPLAERLLTEIRQLFFHRLDRAEELVEVVCALVDHLHRDHLRRATAGEGTADRSIEAERCRDLLALAWAYRANIARLRGDHPAAEGALRCARQHLGRGTGDPLVGAEVGDMWASALLDLRRFEEAESLLLSNVGLYQSLGEERRAGRSLIQLGVLYRAWQRPDLALMALARARRFLAGAAEPRLRAALGFNRALYLMDLGKPRACRSQLRRSRPWVDLFPEFTPRRRWLEGLIHREAGELEDAERALIAARDAFLARGSGYDAALVSLDLAAVYLEWGRLGAVKAMAAELEPIFAAHDIHREAMATLILFQQAARAEALSVASLRRLARHLEEVRAQHRFHTPD